MSHDLIERPATTSRPDVHLEGAVVAAFRDNPQVPVERVQVTVHDGIVTLTGNVNWKYQKAVAGTVAAAVRGVSAVENRIDVEIG
jgi:osmotically-inducible protein OsmY